MTMRSSSSSLSWPSNEGAIAIAGDPHPNTAAVRTPRHTINCVRRPRIFTVDQCAKRSCRAAAMHRAARLTRRNAIAERSTRPAAMATHAPHTMAAKALDVHHATGIAMNGASAAGAASGAPAST